MEIGRLNTRNWLVSRTTDLLLLLGPVWVLWIYFFFSGTDWQNIEFPVWAWFIFILGIDVSHVWSSVFRSYAVKDEFQAQKKVLILAPVIAFVLSVSFLSFSQLWFWRIMAYLAVFHFIKQQYGFVALYRLKAGEKRKQLITDKLIIYTSTIYPVVFWHFNTKSTFNWFVEGDFLPAHLITNPDLISTLFTIANYLFWGLILSWLIQEIIALRKKEIVSTGKILWVVTTAINWWFGIVYFNSDVVFSISNVVAHGIPYMVLIYHYRERKDQIVHSVKHSWNWKIKWVALLIATIFIAAFVEEYFWDMLVYREHSHLFEAVLPYSWEQLSGKAELIVAIALLALPQQIHYIIDGYIWKMNAKNKYLKSVFTGTNES